MYSLSVTIMITNKYCAIVFSQTHSKGCMHWWLGEDQEVKAATTLSLSYYAYTIAIITL